MLIRHISLSFSEPILHFQPVHFDGSFIEQAPGIHPHLADDLRQPVITEACVEGNQHVALFVTCQPIKCGSVKKTSAGMQLRIRDDQNRGERRSNDGDASLRVVGGAACEPQKWPYIIAMYRDGSFHCGGTIHTPHWVRQINGENTKSDLLQ